MRGYWHYQCEVLQKSWNKHNRDVHVNVYIYMFILSSLLLHLYLVYLALFSAFCSFKSYLTFNIKTTRVGCKQEVQSKLRVNKMRMDTYWVVVLGVLAVIPVPSYLKTQITFAQALNTVMNSFDYIIWKRMNIPNRRKSLILP